jgi:DNA invertase Pin-like site-specific DNA recombinase
LGGARIYADDGISGTNTKKRERFNKMIKACKAGKIDLIVTKSISRFARDTIDYLKDTRDLKTINVAISCKESK